MYVALSRAVNKNAVVPSKVKHFEPKLARPPSEKNMAASAIATLSKRQLVNASSSAPELFDSVVAVSFLDTRLVKNKKMRCKIFDDYQKNMVGLI